MTLDFSYGSLATMIVDYIESLREEDKFDFFAKPDYHEYIKSDAWKHKADEAKRRAGDRCQICNKTGKLEAHHRTYENLGDEQPGDIIVLCRECHELFSRNRRLYVQSRSYHF